MIDFDIAQIFPKFLLNDRNGLALAKAIEAGLNYFLAKCQDGLDTLLDVDKMPEWRLDELAWEEDIRWYDGSATLEQQRQTVLDARKTYARLGTPDAILRAINGIFGAGRVEEWWEYSGDPYHFKIYVTDETAATSKRELLLSMLAIAANARSVLDEIIYSGASGSTTCYPMTQAIGACGRIQVTAT